MPDLVVFAGLGLLTFVLGLGWFLTVSRTFFATYRKPILVVWGGACGSIVVFLTAVDYLHLGNIFFGWMR